MLMMRQPLTNPGSGVSLRRESLAMAMMVGLLDFGFERSFSGARRLASSQGTVSAIPSVHMKYRMKMNQWTSRDGTAMALASRDSKAATMEDSTPM